jgi:hypothetical protein
MTAETASIFTESQRVHRLGTAHMSVPRARELLH